MADPCQSCVPDSNGHCVFARFQTATGSVWVRRKGDPNGELYGDPVWEVIAGTPWEGTLTGEVLYDPQVLLAPLTPTKIIAIGQNYRDHAREMNKPVPEWPKIFFKPPSSIIGPGDAIKIPPQTIRVDHEAELGVVIKKRCFRVSAQDALDYVFGYTCINDVTARDFQAADGVFARAKGFDSFCPAGPYLVTGLDAGNLPVRARVNGTVRQDGTTSDMVFGIAELIAFVSNIMTLEPGDVISTGTPAGVGPLTAGQQVEIEIPGIGKLINPVVNRDDR